MTDEELNRAVAEARGWNLKPGSNYQWIMPDNRPSALPDVCSSPIGWGPLLEELAATMPQVELLYTRGQPKPWYAVIWRGHQMFDMVDHSPGRALALAFLKAVRV